jgi:hypothetical protein
MDQQTNDNPNQSPEGTATHSGWNHFYVLFSRYRDECLKVGQIVFGTSYEISLKYLPSYHSALYSMAQQIFSFYDPVTEKEITEQWFDLSKEINDVLYLTSDRDFKRQMLAEGREIIPKELKIKLLMFFNKIDRLAAEAGLLVGKENKGLTEPKKGLVGFKR